MPVLMIRYKVAEDGITEVTDAVTAVAKWAVGNAPTPQPLDLLGAYRLFE